MTKVSRYKKRSSDRSGFDYKELELVKDKSHLVNTDEFDTPPPSKIHLGGEGDSSGDPRSSSDFTSIGNTNTPVNDNPVNYIAPNSGIDQYTVLMLHADGTDASTTFSDSSPSSKTVTANADAQIDTAQSKFGGASALFDGTGDYLSIPDSDDFDFSVGDFTIDFWIRFNSVSASQTFYFQRTNDDNYIALYFDVTEVTFRINVAGTLTFKSNDWSPSANTWYHFALVKSVNDFMMFVDGSQIETTLTSSITWPNFTSAVNIGLAGSPLGDRPLNGWIDEYRVSKGIARWTSNFTVPSSAYSSRSSITPNLNHPYMIVAGSNENVTIVTNPRISSGKQNDILTLYGVGSSITLNHGNSLNLMGSSQIVLNSGSYVTFMYSTGNTAWNETSRGNV